MHFQSASDESLPTSNNKDSKYWNETHQASPAMHGKPSHPAGWTLTSSHGSRSLPPQTRKVIHHVLSGNPTCELNLCILTLGDVYYLLLYPFWVRNRRHRPIVEGLLTSPSILVSTTAVVWLFIGSPLNTRNDSLLIQNIFFQLKFFD
jgi:hypothetical protein